MTELKLSVTMSDFFFSPHHDYFGTDPYRDEIQIVDDPDAPGLWLSTIARNETALRHLFILLEPVCVLMQAMGLKVTDIFVVEPDIPCVLHFDRGDTTAVCRPSTDEPIPIVTDEGIQGMPDGADIDFDVGMYQGPTVTIALKCITPSLPQGAAQALTTTNSNHLRFFDGAGYVYLYVPKEMGPSSIHAAINTAMGNDAIVAQPGTIRRLLIDIILDAIPGPVDDSGTPLPVAANDPIDPIALWSLGLIYSPRQWIMPNLWLEPLQEVHERVRRTYALGEAVWAYITLSRAQFRRFLEYETTGFGGTNGRLRPEEITVDDLLDRIQRRLNLAEAAGTYDPAGQLHPRRSIEKVLDAVNARQRFARQLETPWTMKEMTYADVAHFSYSEFLTYLYRQGALDFQGLTSPATLGLRLPDTPDDEATYERRRADLGTSDPNATPVSQGGTPRSFSQATRALIGASALHSPQMLRLQVELMGAWEAFLVNPEYTRARLGIVRDELLPFIEVNGNRVPAQTQIRQRDDYISRQQANEIIARVTDAVAVLEGFTEVWDDQTAQQEYWKDQSLPNLWAQEEVLICFQFLGVALSALDPIFVVASSFSAWQAPGVFLEAFNKTSAINAGLNLDPADAGLSARLSKLASHHREMFGAVPPPLSSLAVQAGLIHGGCGHIIKLASDAVAFACAPQQAIDRLIGDFMALLEIPGDALFAALGKAAREGIDGMVNDLLSQRTWYAYSFRLGQLIAPLAVEIIVELLCEAYVIAPILKSAGQAVRATIAASSDVLDRMLVTARILRGGPDSDIDSDFLLGRIARLDLDIDAPDVDHANLAPFIRSVTDFSGLDETNFVHRFFELDAADIINQLCPPGSLQRTNLFNAIQADPQAAIRIMEGF